MKLSNLPVLKLDVVNGDINFEQVARARVRVRYTERRPARWSGSST